MSCYKVKDWMPGDCLEEHGIPARDEQLLADIVWGHLKGMLEKDCPEAVVVKIVLDIAVSSVRPQVKQFTWTVPVKTDEPKKGG